MPNPFITRPIFAAALALVIVAGGTLSLLTIGITRYPAVAPPAISIDVNFPGASADLLHASTITPLERQLSGLSHLTYTASTSRSNGSGTVTATFTGITAEAAQTLVQNRVQSIISTLPAEVQKQGVAIAPVLSTRVLALVLYDRRDRMKAADISDYVIDNVAPLLTQLKGVGRVTPFGSAHAMRIWLNPDAMSAVRLTPPDIKRAVQAQNLQIAAGQLGAQPAPPNQAINVNVTSQSQLSSVADFEGILLRNPTGLFVHLKDVARVEVGSEDYALSSRMNGHPAAGVNIFLSGGANALDVASRVKALVHQDFDVALTGLSVAYPVDTTNVIRMSLLDVVFTLALAVGLVFIVMIAFLGDWRPAVVPTLSIPIVLLGSIGCLRLLGYDLNILSLFGMVLVIGLLVDDAIIVVENTQRIMSAEKLPVREALMKSSREINTAIFAVGIVIAAVLSPLLMFSGSVGIVYRQFAAVMISAIILSVIAALAITPALCILILKPRSQKIIRSRFVENIASIQHRLTQRLLGVTRYLSRRPLIGFAIYCVIVSISSIIYIHLPRGFLPSEDEGAVVAVVAGPAGSMQSRTIKSLAEAEQYFLKNESQATQDVFSVAGVGLAGYGQNSGSLNVLLKPWRDRASPSLSANAVAQRAVLGLSHLKDAIGYAIAAPVIPELGASSGFDFELENRGGLSRSAFLAARNQFLVDASREPLLGGIQPVGPEDGPELNIAIDAPKALAMNVDPADVASTLQAAWSPNYINDFYDHNRLKRVYMEGDEDYRGDVRSLSHWSVPRRDGAMVSLADVTKVNWATGPVEVDDFNGWPSFELQGLAAQGKSTSAAMAALGKLTARLPAGISYEWSGISYQQNQSTGSVAWLYLLVIAVVFTTLTCLYNDILPALAVLFIFPVCACGCITAIYVSGLENDIYFQVGILTTMALAAKNAILIVEFATTNRTAGGSMADAAVEAAQMRLRPIMMTSVAFGVGILPLLFAQGAGSGSQHAVGASVFGGSLTATVLTLIFIPASFALFERFWTWSSGHNAVGQRKSLEVG